MILSCADEFVGKAGETLPQGQEQQARAGDQEQEAGAEKEIIGQLSIINWIPPTSCRWCFSFHLQPRPHNSLRRAERAED